MSFSYQIILNCLVFLDEWIKIYLVQIFGRRIFDLFETIEMTIDLFDDHF